MGSGDTYGGIMSALGIMLALYQRRRTGEGQYIDASLYGAQLFMAAPTLQPFLASRKELYSMQQSRRQVGNPLWNRYPAKDKWVFLCLENTDENWSKLCRSLDQAGLEEDARFASAEKRAENNAELIALLDGVLVERDARDWVDRWGRLGIVASPIQTLEDIAADPQAWENDYLLKTHCDEVNREVEIRGLPITLSKTPGNVETLGPELGQHTELILFETLGIDWDRIGELKEQEVIP
jgi:crotonobetainyl-CoA:carnitine CoA-transferase CaiB-like acyl-CoA transferase